MAPIRRLLPMLALAWAPPADALAQRAPALAVVAGADAAGVATPQWLAMLRRRLPPAAYDSVRTIVRPLADGERAWAGLVRSRAGHWRAMIAGVAAPYAPVAPPALATIVLGNRGAEDAFTHDAATIGFDLAALAAAYGAAADPANADRLDRFFRHEYAHLMQKAWLARHPWPMATALDTALLDAWTEGLGNRHSLSARWRTRDGVPSPHAARALATLGPAFAENLAAIACADARTPALLATLGSGAFERKWGALPMALWLEREAERDEDAVRRFVAAGPAGVWDLAARHLDGAARERLRAAREGTACGRAG